MATIADILSHYGVRFQHKTQIYIPCPLPLHTSKSSGNSLSVNLERNIWACKSESCIAGRNGKEGGNVLDFVMWMERCDLKSAAAKIMEWFGTKPSSDSLTLKEKPNETAKDTSSNSLTEEHNLVDWLEQKTPPIAAGVRADNSSPPDHNSSAGNGKGYMTEVDRWLDGLLIEPYDWKTIRNGIKARLIESYKAGKNAKS